MDFMFQLINGAYGQNSSHVPSTVKGRQIVYSLIG